MPPTIVRVVTAIMTAQLIGDRAIDAVARRNSRIFVAYIVVLLVTAVLIAVFTWLTWDSGNKLQDAIRQDADARIAEASGKVAGLERDASDAKAAQQKVELDLAKQRERTAMAERSLLQFRKDLAPRRLTGEQKAILSKLLEKNPSKVAIVSALLDSESSDFADDFDSVFKGAHWETFRIGNRGTIEKGVSVGVVGGMHPVEIKRISDALTSIGVAHKDEAFRADDHSTSPWFQPDVLYLVVNRKPGAETQIASHTNYK
jgi:hypothetical protein